MATDDLPEALRDDLRTTIRALDIEVQRLVGVIGRVEAFLRGDAPRRPPTDAAVPLTTPAPRSPTRFEEREPDEAEDRA